MRVAYHGDSQTSVTGYWLQNHLAKVHIIHNQDLSQGFGEVYLPHALERKYPNANKEWNWQYVFPSKNLSKDPMTGKIRRHHVDPSVVNLERGTDIRTIQALFGA